MMEGLRAASIGGAASGYSQAQTSARLATHAPSSATDKAMGNRRQEV
jgi:hypothetical protein